MASYLFRNLTPRSYGALRLHRRVIGPPCIHLQLQGQWRATHTIIYMKAPGKQNELSLDFERQILNPERAETCKSGTDDEVAHHKSSYDPSTTSPENEYLADEEECTTSMEPHHPLFISPARKEVSELLSPMVGGAVHGADRLGPSARGWTRKHKEVHIKYIPGGPYDRYEKLLDDLKKARQSESSSL
ncbi:hypothetical protein BJX96DRAFT_186902 [Aspergillus floccosus]